MCTDVATWFRPDGQLTAGQIGDVFVRFALGGIRA
jgi:hypothetical protein